MSFGTSKVEVTGTSARGLASEQLAVDAMSDLAVDAVIDLALQADVVWVGLSAELPIPVTSAPV